MDLTWSDLWGSPDCGVEVPTLENEFLIGNCKSLNAAVLGLNDLRPIHGPLYIACPVAYAKFDLSRMGCSLSNPPAWFHVLPGLTQPCRVLHNDATVLVMWEWSAVPLQSTHAIDVTPLCHDLGRARCTIWFESENKQPVKVRVIAVTTIEM